MRDPKHYSFYKAWLYCEQRGFEWDEVMEQQARERFAALDLTNEQADAIIMLHIDATARTWTRKNYHLITRIWLALYWLGVGKGPK